MEHREHRKKSRKKSNLFFLYFLMNDEKKYIIPFIFLNL